MPEKKENSYPELPRILCNRSEEDDDALLKEKAADWPNMPAWFTSRRVLCVPHPLADYIGIVRNDGSYELWEYNDHWCGFCQESHSGRWEDVAIPMRLEYRVIAIAIRKRRDRNLSLVVTYLAIKAAEFSGRPDLPRMVTTEPTCGIWTCPRCGKVYKYANSFRRHLHFIHHMHAEAAFAYVGTAAVKAML